MVTTAYPNLKPESDFELAMMTLLRATFPELATGADGVLRVATETPPDLATRVTSSTPFVRVTDIGGGATGRLLQLGLVDIDVFGRSRNQARDLAVAIQALVEGYPHSVQTEAGFVLIDRASTAMRPQGVPYSDTTLRRYYSSYRLSARR